MTEQNDMPMICTNCGKPMEKIGPCQRACFNQSCINEQSRAALTQPPGDEARKGCFAPPRKPTSAMMQAGYDAFMAQSKKRNGLIAAWEAMLDASIPMSATCNYGAALTAKALAEALNSVISDLQKRIDNMGSVDGYKDGEEYVFPWGNSVQLKIDNALAAWKGKYGSEK